MVSSLLGMRNRRSSQSISAFLSGRQDEECIDNADLESFSLLT
jgi:hypothetical protein